MLNKTWIKVWNSSSGKYNPFTPFFSSIDDGWININALKCQEILNIMKERYNSSSWNMYSDGTKFNVALTYIMNCRGKYSIGVDEECLFIADIVSDTTSMGVPDTLLFYYISSEPALFSCISLFMLDYYGLDCICHISKIPIPTKLPYQYYDVWLERKHYRRIEPKK